MMKKTYLAALVATLMMLGLFATALPAAAKPGLKATGGVNWTTQQGRDVHTSFVAQESGKGRIAVAIWDNGVLAETWKGTVTCYSPTGPGSATFGGKVDGAEQYFTVRVADGGEGQGSTDQINSGRFATEQNCGGPATTWPLASVTAGNIQIHS